MIDNNDNNYKHIFLIDKVLLGIEFITDDDLFNEYFNIMNRTFNDIGEIINSKLDKTLNSFPREFFINYDNDEDFESFNDLLKPFYNEIIDNIECFNNNSLKCAEDYPDEINLCMLLDEPTIICKTYKSLDAYKFGKIIDADVDKLQMTNNTFKSMQYFLQKYDQCNIHIIPIVIWDPKLPINIYYIDN